MSTVLSDLKVLPRCVPLSDAVQVNPKIDRTGLADDIQVSFVPMAAVGAASGHIDVSTVRRYAEVKKGYTNFRNGDVLFAKVTPCMENGKMAVARQLKNGVGFGSTEFHVLRPREGVDAQYIYYFVSSQTFRKEASGHMTGAVGLRRVPSAFLENAAIPLPPLERQREIVAELEKQFSRLDEAVANLQRVKANLKRYKASVLKAAVEGRLVETEASIAHREGRSYETGERLLHRILGEKRSKWTGKGKYKEPEPPVVEGLNLLSEGWVYATAEQICDQIASGSTPSPEAMFSGAGEVPFLKVYNLTFDGSLDFTVKPTFVSNATHQGMLARSRSVPGDVLMNIVGPPLGKVSVVPPAFPEWNINQAIVTFRTSAGLVNQLLAHWLLAQPVLSRLEWTAKATAGQHNLQVSTCRKLPIPVPPLAEQIRIVAEVDRHLSIVREVEAEVDTNLKRAQALRQATLVKAFSAS